MKRVNEMIRKKKDAGFTLIELMIVIAVIGILAVVLVPKMGNVKTSAKLAGVQTNYRSVLAAIQGQHYAASADVYTYLNSTFTGNNVLKNPIDTSLTNVSNVAATPGAVISVAGATVPSATAVAAYKGAVVVIPSLTGGSGTIAIYGCDDTGKLITDLSTIMDF